MKTITIKGITILASEIVWVKDCGLYLEIKLRHEPEPIMVGAAEMDKAAAQHRSVIDQWVTA